MKRWFLVLAPFLVFAQCPDITGLTDWLTAPGISRARLSSDNTIIATKFNECADSTGKIFGVFENYTTDLGVKSKQGINLKLDTDNNGTHAFAVLNGGTDTIFRVREDSATKIYGPLTASKAAAFGDSVSVAGKLRLSGGLDVKTRKVSANATLGVNDHYLYVDAGGGNVIVTLPAPSATIIGRVYKIFKTDNGSNTVAVSDGTNTYATVPGTAEVWAVFTDSSGFFWDVTIKSVSGSFTATLTGVSGSVTGTAYYWTNRYVTTVSLPILSGTSNTTACTVTGLPAIAAPDNSQYVAIPSVIDNGTHYDGRLLISGTSTMTLQFRSAYPGTFTSTFTNSGTKGFSPGMTFTFSRF